MPPEPTPMLTLKPKPKPHLSCSACNVEMGLVGIEPDPDNPGRDIFTFECAKCGRLEAH